MDAGTRSATTQSPGPSARAASGPATAESELHCPMPFDRDHQATVLRIMEDHGISTSKLAESCRVTTGQMSRILSGQYALPVDLLSKLYELTRDDRCVRCVVGAPPVAAPAARRAPTREAALKIAAARVATRLLSDIENEPFTVARLDAVLATAAADLNRARATTPAPASVPSCLSASVPSPT